MLIECKLSFCYATFVNVGIHIYVPTIGDTLLLASRSILSLFFRSKTYLSLTVLWWSSYVVAIFDPHHFLVCAFWRRGTWCFRETRCEPFFGSLSGCWCVTLWYLVCAILENWLGAVSPQAHAVYKMAHVYKTVQIFPARSKLVTGHCQRHSSKYSFHILLSFSG